MLSASSAITAAELTCLNRSNEGIGFVNYQIERAAASQLASLCLNWQRDAQAVLDPGEAARVSRFHFEVTLRGPVFCLTSANRYEEARQLLA